MVTTTFFVFEFFVFCDTGDKINVYWLQQYLRNDLQQMIDFIDP